MLQDIRENAQGTIAKIIIGLLIVSLSIWGMDAIIGGFSGEPEVATVNGEDITEREFLRAVQMESQRRLSAMETPDPSLLNEDQVRKDVLESLIREQVLIQDANAQGLALNAADIDALITRMPQFQVDGQFNRDRFVATVRNMGMGVTEFREAMRKQYVLNQIRAGIIQSAVVADENAAQLLRIQNQTRSFRVLDIPASAIAGNVAVTDADVEAFYQQNADAFQQPERVDAAYITLSLGALAENVQVSDEELQAYYDQRAAGLASEERRASHILIEEGSEADQAMTAIQKRLEAGESFADLAREYSIDTISAQDGGDLGYAGRGIYDKAFEEALFALEEGEISRPVRTSFGVHLIRLEDIRRSEVPPLSEIDDQLRRELARDKARERFAEVRAQLADSAYAADDLAGPAKELGLEVREAKGISREGGQAPFDHDGLVRQLFSKDVLEAGYNTELIDVGDNVSVVARVRKYHEAEQLPLAEVRENIRATLEQRKTREALVERAETIIASLEAGESLESVGEWASYQSLARNSSEAAPAVIQQAFSLPRPDQGEARYGKTVTADAASVVALEAVKDGEVAEGSTELNQLRDFLASLEGQREYAAYQQFLRNQAEVDRP
ncbi:SurA N-terminal domain-containing protein [Marinobacter sp. SS8-8]|uniref:SurA N-terminal domain-containing protein n=1 Tax=Marinobacter sp. SS8-8 TaxID=3050452 RepID=UPI000C35DDDF|nr:SurA N-terminal domain-containing protein [Marinobacter sp. SS8-8]MAZ06354.1 peptidylprolyl isomerase [Halomonas sp.]|tara:strand:- start:50699 stop:52546 length:1848 start_codon:yes stop_codon:yes gene_type:complete